MQSTGSQTPSTSQALLQVQAAYAELEDEDAFDQLVQMAVAQDPSLALRQQSSLGTSTSAGRPVGKASV